MFTDDSCILISIEFDRTQSSQKEYGISFVTKTMPEMYMDTEKQEDGV